MKITNKADETATALRLYLGGAKGGLEPLTPCLQNPPGLSGIVAHLELSLARVRRSRPASGPVVVSLSGQPSASSSRSQVTTRELGDRPGHD